MSLRRDLVEQVFAAILEQARDAFPRPARLDVDAIARRCGVAILDEGAKVSLYARVALYERVAGEDLYTLVMACRAYLGDEGYIRRYGPHWTSVVLCERGAAVMGCLPAVLAGDGRGPAEPTTTPAEADG